MGTYGFLRFSVPMLPDATALFTPVMVTLSVVAIIYGAYMALAQSDLKKLIAYSSVSHMGFVTLGIFILNAQGIEGAVMQMVNHGITTGALFLCVGAIYQRTHSRQIADNTGLAGPMPRYATLLVIFSLSSLGLPGTNSFVGEFLVLAGTFFWSKGVAAVASLGIILAAAYLLYMVQRVVFGVAVASPKEPLHDLNWCEMAMLTPLVVLVFWIGLFPNGLLSIMHASVNQLIEQVDRGDYTVAQARNSIYLNPGMVDGQWLMVDGGCLMGGNSDRISPFSSSISHSPLTISLMCHFPLPINHASANHEPSSFSHQPSTISH
jgi:NADH-quinone oxidoreductase subunit M